MVLRKKFKPIKKLINAFFSEGKRSRAETVLLNEFRLLKKKRKNRNNIFGRSETLYGFMSVAVSNVRPYVSIKTKKVGGASYKIPIPIAFYKESNIAAKWLIKEMCGHKQGERGELLISSIYSASLNEGRAVKKRQGLHSLASFNRAYLKYL